MMTTQRFYLFLACGLLAFVAVTAQDKKLEQNIVNADDVARSTVTGRGFLFITLSTTMNTATKTDASEIIANGINRYSQCLSANTYISVEKIQDNLESDLGGKWTTLCVQYNCRNWSEKTYALSGYHLAAIVRSNSNYIRVVAVNRIQ